MSNQAKQIATTLDKIADNNLYDEAALRNALAFPGLPDDKQSFLNAYIKGERESMSHIRLNEVAIWLRQQA